MSNYSIKTFIGIDLGDLENQVCILDRHGEILEKTAIENTIGAVNTFFDRFNTPREVLVAVETGTHSPWISQLLRARGFHILVGNSRKLRLEYAYLPERL